MNHRYRFLNYDDFPDRKHHEHDCKQSEADERNKVFERNISHERHYEHDWNIDAGRSQIWLNKDKAERNHHYGKRNKKSLKRIFVLRAVKIPRKKKDIQDFAKLRRLNRKNRAVSRSDRKPAVGVVYVKPQEFCDDKDDHKEREQIRRVAMNLTVIVQRDGNHNNDSHYGEHNLLYVFS